MRRGADLPNALAASAGVAARLRGRRPAVFLDYDGTLTPIVDRPEDAVISENMRRTVADLARRCSVCVVSGRDRPVVQELMGIHDLPVAGSHGFDIWSPGAGAIERREGAEQAGLLKEVTARLERETATIEGALVEPKAASVAVHYRLVAPSQQARIGEIVTRLLAEHPSELKKTPGKMVYEVQPNIEWDKGRAVLYLLTALNLDGPDVIPIYLGDDETDEHAFRALGERGLRILVSSPADHTPAQGFTLADYRLDTVEEVERWLDQLAR
ncbi:MAG: trehalose-phosphatase [Candidatus Dormibacteraeota bacterium]|nr:trehalose-phosphatase [Candidatus Dormibacteraeota bacterium]